jgi:predicted kinase
MNRPILIIVTGMPGTGKSTFAEIFQRELLLPLIEKDLIKEKLFNTLGWSDRDWSKKVGVAAYELMDYVIEQMLGNGQSLIIESNFKPEFDNEKFRHWQHKFDCKIIQVVCEADRKILYQRFMTRAKKGNRHPGHDDANNAAEWESYFFDLKNKVDPLDVKSKVIKVDTSDFDTVNVESIVAEIKNAM